jgi:peroxiredoxin family protein/rhodanese-related sulfurtransferase/TusA-related sulfurtransferase
MRTSDPDIYAAGDAVEVVDAVTGLAAQIPLAGPANRQGRTAADNVCGRGSRYTATQGTAIVKVFEMTGGATGASERALRRAGRDYRKVYLHPSGHAGYYPGTAPMHVKVLFAPGDGKLLGAQVVGYDGVDKRLDVFATALAAGMTVSQLQDLELAYAPPYGSAKDPANMAGFVASNLLKGDIECWYPEDYPARTGEGTILDVRSPQEFATWHIPGAVNIPVSALRSSLDKLARDKPVFTYCKVGFRSYLAYRLLKQSGFERVETLSGGTMTFCGYHGTGVCVGQPEPPLLSYAEDKVAAPAPSSGRVVALDCSGLQCPGPIRRISETMAELQPGDEVDVTVSDPGFASDAPAWCHKRGHELVELDASGARVRARIRKASPFAAAPGAASPVAPVVDRKTMVVFSGDLDRVLAAFVIANGAVSMGSEVTLFFTFWGLNALRKRPAPRLKKGLLDRMFGWMMPCGAGALKLSKLNMLGMGTALMKHVMASKRVDSLPDMIAQARAAGVKLVACTMSMDVMGITREELIDGVELGGVASFLGESEDAGMTLFV